MWKLTTLVLSLALATAGYNVDLTSPGLVRGPLGSLFGFSVGLHRDRQTSWLLVGAPMDHSNHQPQVYQGGAVYRCKLHGNCSQIPFDTSGANQILLRGRKEAMDSKAEQWFGATLHSAGENGAVVACAPRYVYFSSNLRRRDPVGACWVARPSLAAFQEYSPCRNANWGYHRQGSCQAGFSVSISKDSRRLYIGAPGSYYWQGQVFSQDLLSQHSKHESLEGPETDDDSYLGYSLAVGEFTKDTDPDVAVGMPRGHNLTGQVVLMTSRLLQPYLNLTGSQTGSYFGYSVCVGDWDGDRLDDLLIGAPLHSHARGDYETGQVIVALQGKKALFDSTLALNGTFPRGRFGLALANLGDLNHDGCDDFVIGCPYGGVEGRGVIFIFYGSRSGIDTSPKQVITSEEVGSIVPWGFSIAGGLDLDSNQYPDLIVGAPDSAAAVFLRTRPIVTVGANLKVEPDRVNLEDKGCSLRDNTLVTCFVVSLCLLYKGIGLPPEMEFQCHLGFDVLREPRRAFFLEEEGRSNASWSVTLRRDSLLCKSVYVYIQDKVRDKLSPIVVQASYQLGDIRATDGLTPILAPGSDIQERQVAIHRNCGKDNVCVPDLQLAAALNTAEFVVGSGRRMEMDVIVANRGEDAFEATLHLALPPEVNYVNVDTSRRLAETVVTCSEGLDPSVTEIQCDIGNPFPANTTLVFKIVLAPSKHISSLDDLTFFLNVNSTNSERVENMVDNQQVLQIPTRVAVDIVLYGISEPRQLFYNQSAPAPQKDQILEFYQVFSVGNRGQTTAGEVEVTLAVPTRLVQILAQPAVKGRGSCRPLDGLGDQVGENGYNSSVLAEAWQRWRRDAETEPEECAVHTCTVISCSAWNVSREEPVFLTLRGRVWRSAVEEMHHLDVTTRIAARVSAMPFELDLSDLAAREFRVTTAVRSEDVIMHQQAVPLWVIILAVLIGLILLALLVLGLWKVGFFRRQRPHDKKELLAQNNGYRWVHGDEPL